MRVRTCHLDFPQQETGRVREDGVFAWGLRVCLLGTAAEWTVKNAKLCQTLHARHVCILKLYVCRAASGADLRICSKHSRCRREGKAKNCRENSFLHRVVYMSPEYGHSVRTRSYFLKKIGVD